MSGARDLKGKIVVVTGASRGIGAGIATLLGSRRATVYVTGRTVNGAPSADPGTIDEVAAVITASGGVGIAVQCDHADDKQTEALFVRVAREHGHLDILVNNATRIPPNPMAPPPFWTKSLEIADQFIVGLRSAFVASYFAAPLLLKSTKGLVVNISYYGAVSYHLEPAYGATKAGMDKMAYDMAQDFRPYGVAVVSLWPGPTATERAMVEAARHSFEKQYAETAETPQFSGLAVVALYADPNLMAKTGNVVIAAEAAREYGYRDLNGKQPPSLREKLGAPQLFQAKEG